MRYQRADGLSWDLAGQRVVVLDPPTATLTTLNPVGSLVWQHLDEPRSVPELVDALAARFADVDAARLGTDVHDFVAELVGEGLLVAEADLA